jgi:hypothetical protein
MTEQMITPEQGEVPVGDDRDETRLIVKEVFDGIADFGRQLGKLTFGNVAALSALTAAVLYVIGLVRRVAQLHAEGVSTTRGLGLSSLQDYLLEGLGVIVNPGTALLLVALAILAGGAFVYARLSSTTLADVLARWWGDDETSTNADLGPERTGDSGKQTRKVEGVDGESFIDTITSIPSVLAVIFLVLVIPLAEWAPAVVAVAPLFALALINAHYGLLKFDGWRNWSLSHARASVLALGLTLALTSVLYAYFEPPSLDQAIIRTSAGREIKGRLLAESNGLVYLVGLRDRNQQAAIIAIPFTSVAEIHIDEGVPRFYKTVPELLKLPQKLGVPFWRVELGKSNSFDFVRTGPRGHTE